MATVSTTLTSESAVKASFSKHTSKGVQPMGSAISLPLTIDPETGEPIQAPYQGVSVGGEIQELIIESGENKYILYSAKVVESTTNEKVSVSIMDKDEAIALLTSGLRVSFNVVETTSKKDASKKYKSGRIASVSEDKGENLNVSEKKDAKQATTKAGN